VIAGAHTIIFADDAERARAFLRDVLGFEGVDAGDGWLIFRPAARRGRGPSRLRVGLWPGASRSLLQCAMTSSRPSRSSREGGVEFVSSIEDEGWGRMAQFKLPGAGVHACVRDGAGRRC
jgi:catechol 2,3-dioxygenase-like lactoylglutathione lyase family enzyme